MKLGTFYRVCALASCCSMPLALWGGMYLAATTESLLTMLLPVAGAIGLNIAFIKAGERADEREFQLRMWQEYHHD